MGKLARITWPQEYSELQRIEELLLCGICYDYMDTSVMTPCSHNYCSLCIRKYLHYKTQCPACFEKTFEKDLHTNRILDELVSYFGKIREKLAVCIAGAKIVAHENYEGIQESPRTTPVRPARTNQSQKKPSPKVDTQRNDIISDDTYKGEKVTLFVAEQQKILSSPSTSGACKVATIFTPKSKKLLVNATTSGKTVPCPVCRVEVSEFNINKHLDDCLKREAVTQQPERIEPKRKPLPKLVFSLMKDAELRKKMKELGLPSQGDRKTLESRFHRYSTLYNAECDKREPRPIEELLRQCENEENLEKKMVKFAQAANRLKVTRTCDQTIIEEAQKMYLETNRQNYHSLIAAIKERDRTKKPSVRRSLLDRDSCDVTETQIPENHVNHVIEDEEDPASYSMNAYEATFRDSDSDPCPLQHYASDDPMNFLSFTMTTSKSSVTPPKTPSRQRISDESLLDAPVSPVKNITLRDIKNDMLREDFSNVINDDIFNATTDNESSDDDAVPPSPEVATTSRTTKRPKLTLRKKTENTDDNFNESRCNHLEGQKLALSIARDFTFDTSSNDSVGFDAVNEIVDKGTTELTNVEARGTELIDKDISNVDKENNESSTKPPCPTIVNRPLRKRNCVVRSGNVDANDSTRSKELTTVLQDGSIQSDAREVDKLECTLRIDSPLKRRRGRKTTVNATETIDPPPRRPLRKRLVNSVSTDKSHK